MTDRVVGPLREYRAPMHTGLRTLQVAADAVVAAEPRVTLASLDAALAYLRETIIPQFRAEEFTLFSAVDSTVGAVGASAVLRAQHAAIATMVGDLAQVTEAARASGDVHGYGRYLIPLLHGLYGAIRVHIESEDDVYLELLDEHLSESQVGVIVTNLERISAVHTV